MAAVDKGSVTSGERIVVLAVTLLLVYSAWARGGTYCPFQAPLLWFSGIVVASTAVALIVDRKHDGRTIRSSLQRAMLDPVFYLGAAFVCLLLLQTWNSGRVLLCDFSRQSWFYSAPPLASLPSSVTRGESLEMVRWFFPAWVLLVSVRLAIRSPGSARSLLIIVVLNSTLLALVGMGQMVTGTSAFLWVQEMPCHFFASFGYDNHAAAFFTLLFALSIAMFLQFSIQEGFRSRRLLTVALGAASLVLFGGANLSLSRTGMLLSWLVAGFAAAYGVRTVWFRLAWPARVNLLAGTVAVLCLGYFIAAGFGQRAFDREAKHLVSADLRRETETRWFQLQSALRMWNDNKLFGVGGWGYRYFAATYMDRNEWSRLGVGRANVHNDPAQFLAEFGVVGAALMILTVAVLASRLRGLLSWRRPVAMLSLLGLTCTLFHSLIDLPFRCPAVLYHWLLALAVLPAVVESFGEESPCLRRSINLKA